MSEFEPFFDYDKVNQEMADAFGQAIHRHKKIVEEIFRSGGKCSPKQLVEALKSNEECEEIVGAIKEDIFTIPVIVHVAEDPAEDEESEGIVQRCARCKTVLSFWREGIQALTAEGPRQIDQEDVPWWDEGTLIAKTSSSQGIGMYEITPQDRKLERHEVECVGLPNLE